MIRDVLVLLDDVGERAGPFALSLGQQLDAFVTGLCIRPEMLAETFAGAEIAYAVPRTSRRTPAGPSPFARFEQALAATRSGGEATVLSDLPDRADREIATLSRLHDLIVVEQPSPDGSKPTDTHLETVLLRSGRPCLIVPYVTTEPAFLRTITVAWDGSAVAARALGDALPLLERADRVEVVRVVPERGDEERASGAQVVRHLERHGVSASYHPVPGGIPVADAILSHVDDAGSDLLVMGAYGHSRLREAMLGGASRGILKSMTLPVLMSH